MTNAQRRRAARATARRASEARCPRHDVEGWKAYHERVWREYTAKAQRMAAIRPGKPGYMDPSQQGRPRFEGHQRARRRRLERTLATAALRDRLAER